MAKTRIIEDDEEEEAVDGRWDRGHVAGIARSLRKPSYTLGRGAAEKIRTVNKKRLRRLLSRLMRRRNWVEASGVMTLLLKATAKDNSPVTNRPKFSSAMEILKHLDGYTPSSRRIQDLYFIWMKRIGSMKKWPLKDRFVVQMEYIFFCLGQGDVKDAHQEAIRLMQEREFDNDPILNMVVGLTFCQSWNSYIPKEFRSSVSDESYSSVESEMSGTKYDASVQNSEEHDSTEISENGSSIRSDSETSVRMDKKINYYADISENRDTSMYVDDDPVKEDSNVHSAETSDEENSSFSNKKPNMHTYTFDRPGLESWLMPVKLSYSNEKFKNFMSSHRGTLRDYYEGAIKHLRVALYSSPPLYEALLPLVQMLVLGNSIDEALNELEQFGHSSQTVLPVRAKANILEHIDGGNYLKLSVCYEEILKKDPFCSDSLAKLIRLHHMGEYNTQHLLEMIALHLEASYPTSDIWEEFASCLINISRCEEDRRSVCLDNNESEIKQRDSIRFNTVPEIFTMGKSGKTWKLRGRWWLNRHFSQTILSSEIETGSLRLLAYKAASASHMYGQEVEYVVKACAHLADEDKELYLFLQRHTQNSVGFYKNFTKR